MKKTLSLPLIVTGVCMAAYVATTLWFARGLPAHLATHFDTTGRANGWMTNEQTVRFELTMGVGSQLFIILVFGLIRFIPARFVNMPNKEYWQKPENFPLACNVLTRHGLWLSCMLMLWMILLNYQVAEANRAMPPHLDTSGFVVAMATFAVLLIVWFVSIWRQFRVPVTAKKKSR